MSKRQSGFFHAKNLEEALTPLMIATMIIGTCVIEYPIGTQHKFFSRIYSLILIIMCGLSAYGSAELLPFVLNSKNITIELYAFYILFAVNFLVTVTHLVMAVIHSKEFRRFLKNVTEIDDILNRMGLPVDHDRIFKRLFTNTIFCISIQLLLLILNIVESKEVLNEVALFHKLSIYFLTHYASAMNVFGDIIFISGNWLMKRQFEKVNVMLKGLQIPYIDEFAQYQPKFETLGSENVFKRFDGPFLDIEQKTDALDTLRTIYRRLFRISRYMSKLYWVQNMAGAFLAFFTIIVNVFHVYRLLRNLTRSYGYTVISAIGILLWTLMWTMKVFVTIKSSVAVMNEAQLTAEVLLHFREEHPQVQLEVSARQELIEIYAFSIEIQQILKSTAVNKACVLDYGFFNQFIVSIVTYLILLIQADSIKPVSTQQ